MDFILLPAFTFAAVYQPEGGGAFSKQAMGKTLVISEAAFAVLQKHRY